jgi:phosphoglycolate phosphatase
VGVERFSLIVFDLDGTLIDSRRDIANAANALLVECGARPLGEHEIGRLVGDGAATLVARAFEASGIARPPDALQRFIAIYDRHLLNNTRPYDGIRAVLTALRQRATLAVLTNKPLASTQKILKSLDLAQYFARHLVIGGDGAVPRKPDPTGLLCLADIAGTSPRETLLVGDSIIDWRTARAASTAICMAAYGFGFEGFPLDQLDSNDFRIESPAGLLGL